MSQSSIAEQVQGLASAGLPVRLLKGTRMIHREPDSPKDKFASDLWHSRWVHNVFNNYPLVSKCFGIRFLADACKGLPAFVVGVGPSLDDQIKDLKDAKGRSVIISTDAAFRALLANGITPDLVVSFDCKADQNRLWETVPPHKVPVLFSSCVNRNSIESWPGPILFFNQYHTQDELCQRILPDILPELGQIPSAGTVGNMALLAAHALGCEPICAVGMDFAYKAITPKEGIGVLSWRYRAQDYHLIRRADFDSASWQPTEIKELYDNDERLERAFDVKGEDGKDFKTDPELAFYLDGFTTVMAHFKVPVVNCSPDGMIPSKVTWVMTEQDKVDHAYPKMSVRQAVDQFCKAELQGGRHVLKHLASIIPDPRDPNDRASGVQRLFA